MHLGADLGKIIFYLGKAIQSSGSSNYGHKCFTSSGGAGIPNCVLKIFPALI